MLSKLLPAVVEGCVMFLGWPDDGSLLTNNKRSSNALTGLAREHVALTPININRSNCRVITLVVSCSLASLATSHSMEVIIFNKLLLFQFYEFLFFHLEAPCVYVCLRVPKALSPSS